MDSNQQDVWSSSLERGRGTKCKRRGRVKRTRWGSWEIEIGSYFRKVIARNHVNRCKFNPSRTWLSHSRFSCNGRNWISYSRCIRRSKSRTCRKVSKCRNTCRCKWSYPCSTIGGWGSRQSNLDCRCITVAYMGYIELWGYARETRVLQFQTWT